MIDLKTTLRKVRTNPAVKRFCRPVKRVCRAFGHNFWLKIVSFLLAILFWNFVISSNTSITRTKTLTGINGYMTGRASLSNSGLALLQDPSDALKNLTVSLEVPQASYSRVSSGNVQVTLDVSNIRAAGEQELPLKATTSYGRVVSITPSTVSLDVDMLDSRLIPINSVVINEDEDNIWCNVIRVNPQTVSISGAASVIQDVTSACVYVDAQALAAGSGKTSALPYVLLDDEGNEIQQTLLTRSSSTVSATVDIYPVKEIEISTEDAVSGQPAEGYHLVDVAVQPESLRVAAEQALLDGIDTLSVSPASIEGATQSFSVSVPVIALSDFKYLSSEEVFLNITIEAD